MAERRSLGAHAQLLHVVDAVLVNQADVKGGKVQDEAFVQLEEEQTSRYIVQGSGAAGSKVTHNKVPGRLWLSQHKK